MVFFALGFSPDPFPLGCFSAAPIMWGPAPKSTRHIGSGRIARCDRSGPVGGRTVNLERAIVLERPGAVVLNVHRHPNRVGPLRSTQVVGCDVKGARIRSPRQSPSTPEDHEAGQWGGAGCGIAGGRTAPQPTTAAPPRTHNPHRTPDKKLNCPACAERIDDQSKARSTRAGGRTWITKIHPSRRHGARLGQLRPSLRSASKLPGLSRKHQIGPVDTARQSVEPKSAAGRLVL